jgi:RHS repeat-associated protein
MARLISMLWLIWCLAASANIPHSGQLVLSTITQTRLPVAVSFAYDLNGNLLTDGQRFFEWDDANQLAAVTVSNAWRSEFQYDGLGRRRVVRDYNWQSAIGNWQLTNEVRYVCDGYLPMQERDANNTVRVTYIRGLDLSGTFGGAGGIGGLLARTDNSGSAYYHAAVGGNITLLTDSSGNVPARYRYDPFGRALGMWGPLAAPNVMRFSSMPDYEQADLVGYPFRFYGPGPHRWLNQDPIREAGGLNLYGFVGNNPVSRIDPLGLAWYDYIPGIGPGIAQVQGTAAINALLSANEYNGMADFQQRHPGFGGDIVGGDLGAIAGVANITGATANGYVNGMMMLGQAGIVTKGAQAAAQGIADAADSGLLTKLWNRCILGKNRHHSYPKFLGGKAGQVLTDLDPAIHRELHELLRQNLKDADIPLDAANASSEAWKGYFSANPGAQESAVKALTKASFSIDSKYGTHVTRDLLNNIGAGNFNTYP